MRQQTWAGYAAGIGAVVLCLGVAPGQAPTTDAPRRTAGSDEAATVHWLEERSMLHQAEQAARAVSGQALQWQHPYGTPQPRQAVRQASVWLLDYPGSVITRK